MKLPELKKKVRAAWDSINTWKGVVMQPENFDAEVRQFGDRRYKETWVKALSRFKAVLAYESCLDSWALVAITFNFTSDRWDYEYRHRIIDEFLAYANGLELIRDGLEQLYSSEFAEEKEKANGFFELVAERAAGGGGNLFPVGSARPIQGSRSAA